MRPKQSFLKRKSPTKLRWPGLTVQPLEDRVTPTVYVVSSVSNSGPGSLRDAIASANGNPGTDTVGFSISGTITLTSEIAISEAVNISGNGTTISGNGTNRIFNTDSAATGAQISITYLNFTNGVSADGGAMYVGDESLSISDSQISGCSSSGDGGAVNIQAGGTLKLTRTTISGNTAASSGGGIYFNNGGSGDILDSAILNNKATDTGGGLYFFGVVAAGGLRVMNTTISGNSSGKAGGGIILSNFSGTIGVQNSTIANNNAALLGGGIARTSGTGIIAVESSIISGNINPAAPDVSSTGSVTVNFSAIGSATGFTLTGANNLAFGANLKLSALGNFGGPTLTIRPANDSPVINAGRNEVGFSNDQRGVSRVWGSAADIGAVEVPLSTNVLNANDSGAGSLRRFIADSNLDIDSISQIRFDPAFFTSAKTITLTTGELSVTDDLDLGDTTGTVTISGNNTSRVFNFTTLGSSTLSNLTITKGKVSGNGGAIFRGNAGGLVLSNCTISGSSAGQRGGGIYSFSYVAVTLTNTTLSGNTANFGGGIYQAKGDGNLTLSGCLIFNNSATVNGGGIYNYNGSCTISNSDLSSNKAVGGGGIFNTGGLTLNSVNVLGNSATQGGGIRNTSSSAYVNLNNSYIAANTASTGAGAYNSNNGQLTFWNSMLSGNTASSSGGGIYSLDTAGVVTVINSTLQANSASAGGGISNRASLTVTNSALKNNTSANNGGGILNYGGSLYLSNSTLSENFSAFGGGISSTSAVTVMNSTLSGNSASARGGGLYNYGVGSPTVTSTIISGNNAGEGPDIYSSAPVNLTSSAIGSTDDFTFGTNTGNLSPGINLKLGPMAYNGGPTETMMPAIDSPLLGVGSNPWDFKTDQRGLPRAVGFVDIGAVEVGLTSIVQIIRINPSPTTLSSVSWAVTLASDVTGVNATNFTLSGPGATGASITDCGGLGKNYIVTANTGNDGALTLNFANSNYLSLLPNNIPFAGESYLVNKVALAVTSLTANMTLVNDAQVGPSKLSFTATYSEAMDTSVSPSFSFPVENPGSSLTFASGSWTSSTTYVGVYNVNDFNAAVPNIDVRISGGKDTGGSVFGNFTKADLFSLDTANPIVLAMSRNNPANNKLSSVSWTVTFSEPVTGVTPGNFTLYNGGVGGTPAITGVSGSGTTCTVTASTGGSGSGNLGLYAVNSGSTVDAAGNSLAALPVAGPSYALDFVSPAAAKLTLSTILVNDANVGPNGFTASLKYNELMDPLVNPTVSFPVEFPNSLTANGGSWLDAYTYQAKFNVADLGVTQNNIDIRFSGAQDLVGNVQTPFDAADVFSIDTQNPVLTFINSTTPNGTYSVGQSVNMTLNWSEPVNLTGTLNITLDTGATVSITGPQSGTTLSGTYVVGAGENSPDLNVLAVSLTSGSSLKDDATNNAVLSLPVSNLANNAAIIISTGGSPVVTGFVVNDGAAQRSRLTKVSVNFASPVNAALFQVPGAVTFTRTGIPTNNLGTIGTIVNTSNGLIVSPSTGTVSSILLTFANIQNAGLDYGSLADGRWQLGIAPASYVSPNGPADTQLRRLFGNFDNDTQVGGTDFSFYPPFGATVNSAFDFNNDGAVQADDFGQFGNRYGFTLV